MTRTEFLRALGLGLAGAACAAHEGKRAAPDAPAGKPSRKNWVWISTHREQGEEAWKRELARIKAAGVDAIVPEVYNGRQAHWDSRRLPSKPGLLEMLLRLGRAEGLEVHAWMWSMPCLIPEMLQKHPDWYNVNARGESAADKPAYVDYYRFLDPARPEVREFVQGTVAELAGFSELSGVHLDYIRHPDAILPKGLWSKYNLVQDRVYPQFDYGYTPYSREAFKRAHGVDPMELPDPGANPDWVAYRLDSVTELVNRYLVPAARSRGKQITAAVFPGPTLARRMVYQDWGRWDLDGFLPMLYHNFYEAGPEWVRAQTAEGVATVKKPIYSGLFVPQLDPAGLTATVQAALAGGAAGVSLFEAGAVDEPKWAAFTSAIGK